MWSEREHASRTNVVKVFRNIWLADFYGEIEKTEEKNEAIYLAHDMGLAFPSLWR